MRKSQTVPLVTEPHPEGYTGYPFITLLRYNDEIILTIIDNVTNKQIVGYVLDLCAPNNLDETSIVGVAENWFYNGRNKSHPLSIEFSRLGLAGTVAPILRAYPIEFVTRVIGPLPSYKMAGAYRTKKKKRKPLSPHLEFIDKTVK